MGPIVTPKHRTFMALTMHLGCTLQAILGSGAPVLCQFPPPMPRAVPIRGAGRHEEREKRLPTEGIERRVTGRAWRSPRRRRSPGAAWWIIWRYEGGRTEVLTVPSGVQEVLLPVFSFEEEAELFVWFAEPGGGWRVRESRCGELASVLCGPCKGVRGVALDPLPRMLEDGTFASVRVGRERFLRRILAQEMRTAPERLAHS